MNIEIRDRVMLEQLRVDDVKSYLIAHEWEQVDSIGDKTSIFAKDSYELTVPIRKNLGDYAHLMAQILKVIAEDEWRSQLSVYMNIVMNSAPKDSYNPILVYSEVTGWVKARWVEHAEMYSEIDPSGASKFYPVKKPLAWRELPPPPIEFPIA